MLTVLKTFSKKHVTATRAMTLTLAKCSSCGTVAKILLQNVQKHNRLRRKHCAACMFAGAHRMTDTRLWRIWKGMLDRCLCPAARDFKHYGARGIAVCARWRNSFPTFWEDMSTGYADGLTLERKNVNGPYSKRNCRWASNREQQANKRTTRFVMYQGERMHLAELCRRVPFSRCMLTIRLNQGMTADEAVSSCKSSTYGVGKDRVKRRRMSTI